MQIHRSLSESASHQSEAAPEAWEAAYRQMVLFDLAMDIGLGFFLAYYRNFAVPSIAATLHHNGEIVGRLMKRSYDTAIVTYELITSPEHRPRQPRLTMPTATSPATKTTSSTSSSRFSSSPSAGPTRTSGGHQHLRRKPQQPVSTESSAPA